MTARSNRHKEKEAEAVDMDRIILDRIAFELDIGKICEVLQVEGDDADRLEELCLEAGGIGNPKGIYRQAFVDHMDDGSVTIEGVKFTSRVLRVNLDKAHRVFPYAVTCGRELEEWSCGISDMLERFWADRIKEYALYSAIQGLFSHMADTFPAGRVSRMNPGSLEDWPISEQAGVFALLGDTVSSIGLELTPSYLMLPVKSVSGITFPVEEDFASCQLCPREGCPNRRMEYDAELYGKKFKKT